MKLRVIGNMGSQETDISDEIIIFILLSKRCDKMEYCIENTYLEFNTIISSKTLY